MLGLLEAGDFADVTFVIGDTRIKVKNIIKLPILVWLASEYEDFFLKSNCRVLQSSNWRNSLGLNRPVPF